MVFTIASMVNQRNRRVSTTSDGWTVVTDDGKLSAQLEYTVAVSRTGFEVMTLRLDEAPLSDAQLLRVRFENHG